MADTPKTIIIEGITEGGEQFRPSDWIERMCGALAHFRGRRIHYDPRLLPTINKAGNRCLLLEGSLYDEYPELYNSITDFAKKNKLRILPHNEIAVITDTESV
jgi:hypothetical protein